jgi:hypothetical protein
MVVVLLGASVSAPFWTAAATLPISCPTGVRPGKDGARAVGDEVETLVQSSRGSFASGWLPATVVAVHRRERACASADAETESERDGSTDGAIDRRASGLDCDVERGVEDDGELYFMYRYILRESCSQFDSLPLTSLTIPPFSTWRKEYDVEYDVELSKVGVLRYTLDIPPEPAPESVALAAARQQPFLRGTHVAAQFKRRRIGGVVRSFDAAKRTYSLIFPDGDVRPAFAAQFVTLEASKRSVVRFCCLLLLFSSLFAILVCLLIYSYVPIDASQRREAGVDRDLLRGTFR